MEMQGDNGVAHSGAMQNKSALSGIANHRNNSNRGSHLSSINGQLNSNGTGALPTPGGINSRNISEATNSPTGTGQNIYSTSNNGLSSITKRKSNNVVNGVTDGGAAIRAQYDRHGNKLDSVELPSVGQTRSAIHTSGGAASMAGNRNSLGGSGPNGNGHHMQLPTGIVNKAAAAAPIIVQRNPNEEREQSN